MSHSGSHHSFDMKKDMGGLRKYMPHHVLDVHHRLARARRASSRSPGFWSKDEILVTAGENDYDVFLVVGLIGAFLTAAYMTRCVYLTFFGEYRGPRPPARVASRAITVPLDHPRRCFSVARRASSTPRRSGIEKFTEWVEPTVAFPELAHAEFDVPAGDHLGARRARSGIGIAAYFWFRQEELGPLKGLTRAQHGSRTPATRSSTTSTTSTYLYEDVIVASIKGPIASGVVLVQPARHRQRRQRHRARARASSGTFTYDVHRPEGRRRRRQRHRRQSPARAGGAPALRPDPVACSATPCSCSPRSGSSASSLLHRQRLSRRGIAPMDWFDDWALTLAVFIPVGRAW